MGDDNTEIVKQAEKQVENKPLVGFAAHPENINKNGRPPKGHSITETIRAMMDEKPEIKKALGAKILQMAVEGDIQAIRTIWGYLDGMPAQKNQIDVTQIPTPLLDKYVHTNDSSRETTTTE